MAAPLNEIAAVCYQHTEVPAAAACTRCGSYGCNECLDASTGLCEECREATPPKRSLRTVLGRLDGEKTPELMKAAVVLNALAILPGLSNRVLAVISLSGSALISLLFTGVTVALLVAIWRMRRWAVIVWALLSIYSIGTTVFYLWGISNLGLAIGTLLRLLPIIVAIGYWKRMR